MKKVEDWWFLIFIVVGFWAVVMKKRLLPSPVPDRYRPLHYLPHWVTVAAWLFLVYLYVRSR